MEEWLSRFTGAVLLVSHDRVFLDLIHQPRGSHLDPLTHTARGYAGNYTAYLEQSLAEHERQVETYQQQAAEIRRMKQEIARTMEQSRSVERSTTPRQPNVRRVAKKVARKAKSREK